MKKYLMTAATALVLGGLMTSCTHDTDVAQTASQDIIQQYEKVFTTAFGTPAPNQTWGFGDSSNTIANTRAFTRTFDDRPQQPTFSSDIPLQNLQKPEFYNTLAEARTALGNSLYYSKDRAGNYQNGDVIYIDKDYSSVPDNRNLTIYVDGNVTFSGNTLQSNGGVKFIVTSKSTLTISSLSQLVSIYLAPEAKLKLANNANVNFDNNWSNVDQNGSDKYSGSPVTYLYLSPKSTVEGGNKLSFQSGAKVYNDGGTIHVNNLDLNDFCALKNEGSITVDNDLSCTNQYSYIRNASGKKITVNGKLELKNNHSYLYNEGEVDVEGAITLDNTNAEIVNNGKLSGASLSTAAGGKVHNKLHATVVIDGETKFKNIQDCWMNDGSYTSGSFTIKGQANQIYNNCMLTVNGLFNIYESGSKFVLQGDASLVCESFQWKQAGFYMGSRSLLKVKGVLYSENMNSNSDCGFHGPSGSNPYAVIQAEEIRRDEVRQYSMIYKGNLYVDTKVHFPWGALDPANNPPSQPYYYFDSSVKFSFDDSKNNPNIKKSNSPVSIDPSDCSPGYEGDDDDNKEADPDVVRIIAEDLTWGSENGDFDFNDVVFDVSLSDDKETITITLRAAGGTLPLRIAGNDDFEVHKQFGVPTGTIVNTGTALSISKPVQTWSFPNRDTRNYTLVDGQEVAQTYGNTVKEVAYNLPVEVYKLVNGTKVWVELQAPVGKAAAKVAVDNTYDWCDERESIDAKYYDRSLSRGKFSMYVRKLAPYAEDNSWYK